MNERILRFVLTTADDAFSVMDRFTADGRRTVNSTKWMGWDPRTCSVTKCSSRSRSTKDQGPATWDIEVTHRSKEVVTYVGNTRYEGWDAVLTNRTSDGTLLDGAGKPLPDGSVPVGLKFAVVKEIDFNAIDFGDFQGQAEADGIQNITRDEAFARLSAASGRMESTIFGASFVAPRRHRPNAKVMLSNMPSGELPEQGGSKLYNVNNDTSHIEFVLAEKLTEIMFGFIEGRLSIKSMRSGNLVYVDLDDSLIDCTANEVGGDTLFNILGSYLPPGFLEDLARRVSSMYAIKATVVTRGAAGLLLEADRSGK